jgi:hypothetical protein
MPAMQPAFMDLFSSKNVVIRRSAASVGAVWPTFFYRRRLHLGHFPPGVHTASIRVRYQGLFRKTRRDLDEAACTSSQILPFLDPACAVVSFRIVT